MVELSEDQKTLRAKITRGALIWGAIGGLVVFLLALWLLGNLGPLLQWGIAIIVGAGVGVLINRVRYNSGVAKALCEKCGTAFAIREVARKEQIVSSDERTKTETVRPPTTEGPGLDKVSTWTEEKVEITAIDECANCHDRTERKWTTTREQNKVENEVSVAQKLGAARPAAAIGASGRPDDKAPPPPPQPQPPSSRSTRSR